MRKYRNHYFFYIYYYYFFFGGGGGVPMLSKKLAVNRRTKFRNTHWSDKSLTNVEDKPWK